MTLQEAQAKFSGLIAGLSVNMGSGALVAKQGELQALLDSLPNTTEFDPVANAIAEVSPKLLGTITQAVLKSLQSRDAVLKESTALITGAANAAAADARSLTFEKPKLVLATLTQSITALKDIKTAARAQSFEAAASKIDALVEMIEQARKSITAA